MANVKLSKEESELVTDAGVILTKNRIIARVYDMFGLLAERYQLAAVGLPAEVTAVAPKISRGENYRELPWVMLDYPRRFSATDVFAIRSFFWWGHFFSITLQLQGSYKDQMAARMLNHLDRQPEDWWIGINADPWEHHFDESNYRSYIPGETAAELPVLKLAKKIPLDQWDNVFAFMEGAFLEITGALSTQAVK